MAGDPLVTDRVVTIPNALSSARLALVPVFVYLLLDHQDGLAVLVLLVSGFTDYLDGHLARRLGQISRVGQVLDPVADRLFIFSTLVGFWYRDIVPWWLVLALVGRDVALICGGFWMARRGYGAPPVHILGKAATLNLLYAFPLLLLGHADGEAASLARAVGWAFAWWGVGLYWWTGLLYMRQGLSQMRTPLPPAVVGG